jgi:uncharacterized protein (TIGR02996 family)
VNHPDWPAFLAAIVADPDDDTARLVAADFLEEHGDPDRAAFVRAQVELARLEAAGRGKTREADELRKREKAYLGPLSVVRIWWAAEDCPELVKLNYTAGRLEIVGDGADRVTWRRGFIEAVTCPALVWLRYGEAVRKRNPVRDVTLTRCDRMTRDNWYAAMAPLTGLRVVKLLDGEPGTAGWLGNWLPGTEVEEASAF